MIKHFKYYFTALIIIIIGVFTIHKLLSNYDVIEQQKIENRLKKTHTDALNNAKAAIAVYATIVSSLKSYIKNTQEFPSEKQLQNYLKDILKEIEFDDSIIVSYLNTDHVFTYVITPNEIDPANLKGINVKDIRPKKLIDELDDLMDSDDIKLFEPINLREGWTGFPFNFSAKNNKNEVLGYITPVLNVKYLLNFFYKNNNNDQYVHKFLINETTDLTREAFYDGSSVYSKVNDMEYYKNFDVLEKDFIYSTVNLFGLNLKVGSAYKNKPTINKSITGIAYFWYVLLSLLIFLALNQYLNNKSLNKNLKHVNTIVVDKNRELENNLNKIQTLIKEIHHRVKNNMQMISGILNLQENEYEDDNIKRALKDSQSRIQSMSLVHEKLYGNTTLKDVEIKGYVIQLLEYVEQTVRSKPLKLIKQIHIDQHLVFDADTAANLGLIINELVTNSFKHAFKKELDNKLDIEITKVNTNYKLVYIDSGKGLPDNFNIETAPSLGMQLIYILTEQLSGTFNYDNTTESTFTINFQPLIPSFSA